MKEAHGLLALVYIEESSRRPAPWSEGARQISRRFSNNPAYQPFDWMAGASLTSFSNFASPIWTAG